MSAARSASDRSDAHRIYELIDNIDASIARNHPNVAAELDRIRPLYRNTVVLEDLYRSGGIKQGNISLERLGNLLGSGKQTVRRKGNELDELANIGRELKLRARWEPVGEEGGFKRDLLRQALGTAMGATATTTGFRSPYARAAQRMVSRRAERLPTIGPRSIGSATGTISGQFDKEE
jgi:hypothetical protein